MPLSDFKRGTGERVHGGETGRVYSKVGEVRFLIAARIGIDANLFAVLKWLADELELVIVGGSIDTGEHTKTSRHYQGRAIDIVRVGQKAREPEIATVHNLYCLKMIEALFAAGWKPGEGGPWPALLLGPPRSQYNRSLLDHPTHLHLSVAAPAK